MGPSAADLRSLVARHRLKLFQIGARADMHPVRVGAVLNEKVPLRPDVAERLRAAIAALASDGAQAGAKVR